MATLHVHRSAPRLAKGRCVRLFKRSQRSVHFDTVGWFKWRIEWILLFTARVFFSWVDVVRISDSVVLLCDQLTDLRSVHSVYMPLNKYWLLYSCLRRSALHDNQIRLESSLNSNGAWFIARARGYLVKVTWRPVWFNVYFGYIE